MVPSDNSAFSFRPSVVKLDLTEKFKYEAGLAITLARAQICLKDPTRLSKPVYSVSDSPSTTLGSASSLSSLRTTHCDADSPARQIHV